MSKVLLAFTCALALFATTTTASAEEVTQDAAAAVEQSTDTPGCPYSEGGKCCATCQDRAARAAAGEEAQAPMAECPCQRAKRLRAEAAAKAAAEQQQN